MQDGSSGVIKDADGGSGARQWTVPSRPRVVTYRCVGESFDPKLRYLTT